MQDARPCVCALQHRQPVRVLWSAKSAWVPALSDGRRPQDAIREPQTVHAPSKRRFAGAQQGQERRVGTPRPAPYRSDDGAGARTDPDVIDRCQHHFPPGSKVRRHQPPRPCNGEARRFGLAWKASRRHQSGRRNREQALRFRIECVQSAAASRLNSSTRRIRAYCRVRDLVWLNPTKCSQLADHRRSFQGCTGAPGSGRCQDCVRAAVVPRPRCLRVEPAVVADARNLKPK